MNDTVYMRKKDNIIQLTKESYSRNYGVIIQLEEQIKMHFETCVRLLPHDEDHTYHFEINRQQVYFNGKAPDTIMDRLADDLGKALYPVTVSMNASGYLQSITNHEQIKKRWRDNKELLTRYYKGPIAAQAIQSMEDAIYGNTLLAGLKNDWFMSLFFSGIYGLQSDDFRNISLLTLPVIPYSNPLQYAITREITEQHTENKCFIIDCKGLLEDKRNSDQILRQHRMPLHAQSNGENGLATGNIKLNYLLYHSDYSIRSITGSCNISINEKELQAISFEMYHLPEKVNTPAFQASNE